MIEDLFRHYMTITDDPQAAATLVLADVTAAKTKLLSAEEAAAQLGVGVKQVYAMCESGQLRCQRVGRKIKIEPEALTEIQTATRHKCFRA